MQTENLKWCGIASCDVNNPFLTFACWFCISNGNVFSAIRVKGCPQWQVSYFGRRTFSKGDSHGRSALNKGKGTVLTGELARLPNACWNFFLALMSPFVQVMTVDIIFLPCQFVEIVLPSLSHIAVLVSLVTKSSKSLFLLYENSLITNCCRHRNL